MVICNKYPVTEYNQRNKNIYWGQRREKPGLEPRTPRLIIRAILLTELSKKITKCHCTRLHSLADWVGTKILIDIINVWTFPFSLIYSLLFKDLSFNCYLLLLQLVLCCVAALTSLPVHHPQCRLYFPFGPLRSGKIFREIINVSVYIHFLTNAFIYSVPFG